MSETNEQRAKEMTRTIRDIIGVEFDGQRVQDYIESELRDACWHTFPCRKALKANGEVI